MSNIVDFSKYAGRKPSGKKPSKPEEPKLTTRCEQVHRLVVGKHVTEVVCTDDENFTLIFENGAKLNLMISMENDLNEVLSIIEQNSDDD